MTSAADRERQMREAEELLFTGEQREGFAKQLFRGRFAADWLLPYPQLPQRERPAVEAAVQEISRFCQTELDARRIDREATIPQPTIQRLAELGVLGMTAPVEVGGRGFSQTGYCRVMEILGGCCSATSIFVNAHHSIGMRALLLFGTDEQKRHWLPPLVRGEQIAAFALTEPEAGSDAGNVQTLATPSEDGQSYVLNGEKRYITNGAIAQVLTVMARTPVPGRSETAVTAFLVTPDLPGFRVVEPRMEKLGIRGTATARLAFENLRVPAANVLGPLGKGLKVALTVLDFGRTTFGACCTGAAKTCLQLAVQHAQTRRQFGRPLAEFELVRKKLARMAALTYAMEAMTYVTASLIDRQAEDYMLETAMLKVYTTEALWRIVNDAFQIHGGAAYFADHPLERMLRDARINQIGEGANEVLTSFIALVGMRQVGEELRDVWNALHQPLSGIGRLSRFLRNEATTFWTQPAVPIGHTSIEDEVEALGRQIRQLGIIVQRVLVRHREEILEQQLVQERIARIAMELYASCCVLSRLDAELPADSTNTNSSATDRPLRDRFAAGRYFLRLSLRRIDRSLEELVDNDDDFLRAAAHAALEPPPK